jgi:hypothetical protein
MKSSALFLLIGVAMHTALALANPGGRKIQTGRTIFKQLEWKVASCFMTRKETNT